MPPWGLSNQDTRRQALQFLSFESRLTIGIHHSRHLVTEWLHRQLYLYPRTKGLTLRCDCLVDISSDALDKGPGHWYNVYTIAIQTYWEVFHNAQDRSHFSQD